MIWEYVKLIKENFGIQLSDRSIYNILHKHKITKKRIRNKYYPDKREGQEKQDLETFYNKLKQYDYTKMICLDETSIVSVI